MQDEAHLSRTSFGLIGMRERAAMIGGRLQVISRPGSGTRIEIHLPLTSPSRAVAGSPHFLTVKVSS